MKTITIKLPDVGEGVTKAELVEWNVKIGDLVREDDVLGAVMTDKATVEIPSICAGKIVWLGGEIGDDIAVGADLIRIETEAVIKGAPVAEPPAAAQAVAATPAPDPAVAATGPAKDVTTPIQTSAPRPEGAPVLASPAVRGRARDAGIDLRQVKGSGPAGRITNQDLDAVFAATTATPVAAPRRTPQSGIVEEKIIGLRRKIAEAMSEANTRIPHITVVEEVDVTALENLRQTMNSARGERPKLTVLPYVVAAIVRAVADKPAMNAHFDDDTGVVRRFAGVHAGIATMTDKGLVVPVLRHAEARGLWDMAAEIARLSAAARDASARREDLSGSTITVTSLGPLGAIATTPIINRPEVAIVGVNRMQIRPHWDGSTFVPRKMMNISCSFDHRVIDGWDAAVFVNRLKTLLENPALIFIED